MKNYLYSLLLTILISPCLGQGNIGIGTTNPDQSALLELKSTDKGLLLPRLTTQQRNSILSPVPGLMIYNSESGCVEFYNGTFWMEQCGTISIANGIPDGIYVSVLGNDITGDGSPSMPFRTVGKGIEQAMMVSKDTVVIATGQYVEPSLTISNKSDLVILGSYNENTWQKDTNPASRSEISSSTPGLVNAVFSIDMCNTIVINGVDMYGLNGTTSSPTSYGLYAINSSDIFIEDCSIAAGNGLNGQNGIAGTPGSNAVTDGENGSQEFPGTGGNPGGGNGGSIGFNGGNGNIGGGIGGGAGGLGQTGPNNGMNGANGAVGANGTNGGGGSSFGTPEEEYQVADSGGAGGNGSIGGGGGGGGAGGGAQGGGGGGYGSGGLGGTGGASGGGSFGVYIFDSAVSFDGGMITSGNGGHGGSGGDGGLEGTGSSGGLGGINNNPDFGSGGSGGAGGNGGNGGHGGGGGGGPSFCIYDSGGGALITITGTSLVVGIPGNGGASTGNPGNSGDSGQTNF